MSTNIDPRKEISKRLANMSMRALARELGVSPTYISDVMAGHMEPGPGILDPLGIECHVTVKKVYRRKRPQ